MRDTLIEGFSHFVTSMTAPIASGWSGCRVGLAPTGKRRLCTAHARSGSRSSSVNDLVSAQQDCFGDGHSEGFRDLEVYDQLKPRRALDGEVCRLSAA